jgi:D-alanyl-D-alanine carboxypeptidase (penicillin-binding protein 5/6)
MRQRGTDDYLVWCLILLSVLLAAVIVTFVIIKTAGHTPNADQPKETPSAETPEETPSENDGETVKPWREFAFDSSAITPLSTTGTVTLDNNFISSRNAIMVNVQTGEVVCQLAPDEKIFPASLTKIMTVIVACELIEDMNETVTLSKTVLYPLNNAGASMAYFKANNPITMIDLLYGALLPSGADACIGLALGLAGTEEAFVAKMNEKAAELGCKGTHFTNASGLHGENHYSTVRDLAAMLRYLSGNQTLKSILSTKKYVPSAPIDNSDGTLYCRWSGSLSGRESEYAKMFAAKTGYTPEAGQCLASISKTAEGDEYVLVTVNAKAEVSGDSSKHLPFVDAKLLFDEFFGKD